MPLNTDPLADRPTFAPSDLLPYLVTVTEAVQARPGLSHKVLRAAVRRGELRGYKIAGSHLLRLDARDLDNLVVRVDPVEALD